MHTSCSYAGLMALLFALVPAAVEAQVGSLDGGLPSMSDAGAASDAASASDAGAPALVPPRVLESTPPVYPTAHLAHGEHPTVVLKVTILPSGQVADLSVEHTAGKDFDDAAIAAVREWTFEPARRGEQPIASRIGIAVHFDLPELGALEVASVPAADVMVPHAHEGHGDPHANEPARDTARASDDEAYGAVAAVESARRDEARGVSDFALDRALLEAAPHAGAAEMLASAPGLVVARIEGDAVGHRLMLRGFDADHGQDIELTVDGVPVNQPSHIHGQGYVDLGFVIPETVRRLRVVEGVYDPAQGDFAVAGSADFQLGVERRGITLSTSYGAFDTFRELALWAPHDQPTETFAAVLMQKSDGFGKNRASTSGAAIAQGVIGHGKLRLVLHGSAYGARARTANVVRRDDIESGKVGFYDVYPYPTAESQVASSTRVQLSAALRYRGSDGDNGELTLYTQLNDFRLLANYTGFSQRSQVNPAWTGRGDLIEQLNQDRTLGLRARYRTARWQPRAWAGGTLELGLSARADQIEQAQNLLEAPANTTWDRRIDADISALDVGGYLDLDLEFTRFLRLKGGARADLLSYRVADALQNLQPAFRGETYIPGYRRSAAGIAAGPRVVLEVTPVAPLVLSAAYGEGYRSPQALLLDEGEPAPFVKVRSADVGARLTFGQVATVRASGFYTHLQQDIVFEADEGRAEAVGPSTRLGAVVHGEVRPLPWLRAAGSVTYVRATLDEPPPRTAEDPSPPFEKGQRLAYVPPCVVRVDASAEHALADVAGAPLSGRAGLGFTYWSERPLPYGERSPSVALLDGVLALQYRKLELSASLFNLLDRRYAALELSAVSNWDPTGVPSRLPARHVMAGAPRTWLFTLGAKL